MTAVKSIPHWDQNQFHSSRIVHICQNCSQALNSLVTSVYVVSVLDYLLADDHILERDLPFVTPGMQDYQKYLSIQLNPFACGVSPGKV